MTRKTINDLISRAIKGAGVKRGQRLEVAFGGEASKSGIWQGQDREGFGWGGDLTTLAHARKVALPGDVIDVYIYDSRELLDNLMIQLPDPSRNIQGWYARTSEPRTSLSNRLRRVRVRR